MPRKPSFDDAAPPLFREVQQFRQPWIWIILIVVAAAYIVTFVNGVIRQIFFGEPFGSNPTSDTVLIVIAIASIVVMVGIIIMFYCAKLITIVRRDGVFVRFVPFHARFHAIPLEGVISIEARTYRPIAEYGGWGIRYSWKAKAYNVSGNRGVEFRYANGSRLLIGSQRPEELQRAAASLIHGGVNA